MNGETKSRPVYDPQDLEPLLVSRQHTGDVDGMLALYEPHALLDTGGGILLDGHQAIRALVMETVAAGQKFARGEQRPARICGDLALTSTRLPDGTITAEVARRQPDGSWLWVIDRFSILE